MATDNGLVYEDVLGLFPVGMHVLAVDDNHVCLNMLETMLLKCHYKVTTTTESVKALEMLRKNKDMFDLVICDVNMPEMDGFKLLKQVGELGRDLPFIMLSGHGDTESVMKGVMNGASDYILKPIRMEEVKTIWQHVVRKKIDGKYQKKVSGANEEKKVSGDSNEEKIGNVARVCSPYTTSHQNAAVNDQILGQKRKERSDSEEDNDTDDSTEKKPRFVWDTELHNKFVVAVNQLGFDKAYPKKILELMNVQGLTRENVASHLQKFRLSLKRSDKQPRTDAIFDSTSPYLPMGSVGGRRFINSTLPSYGSGQLVCPLNTPPALNFRRTSYASVPPFQSRNNTNSFQMPMVSANESVPPFQSRNNTNGFQMPVVSANESVPPFQSRNNTNGFQMPMVSANERSCFLPDFRTSIGTNQFQQNDYRTGYTKLSSIQDPKAFTPSSSYQGFKVAANNNANSSFVSCIPSIHHPLTHNVNSSSFSCIPSNQPLTHNLEPLTKDSLVGSAVLKTQSSNNIFDPVVAKTQSPNNTLDSVGVADMKRGSQSMINPLGSVKTQSLDSAVSLAKSDTQLITQMPETEKFYTDPEAMNSNDDCFYNQMLSLQPGFFDNSCVSLNDIYLS
ncbi:unnamed protein product [Vicia faba]|uniref:Two-component response regulator n=1 Tax=Vicia faba TaxID=3906 RepID=A0AAV1ASD9_VICFA|nr:unnamed protein product [Vicia faba]